MNLAGPVGTDRTNAAVTVNPGITVVTDAQASGLVAWWRLSGEVTLEALRLVWLAHGMDAALLPQAPGVKLALSRTAAAVPRLLPKKLKTSVHQTAEGWAVVQRLSKKEVTTVGNPFGSVLATLALEGGKDEDKRLVVSVADVHKDITSAIHARFKTALEVLTDDDISGWLTWRVRQASAVALRDTGGFYYLPETAVDFYRRMAAAVHEASAHRLFEIPALKTDKAVEAILASVLSEAETAVGRLETALDTGTLGKRALRSSEAQCEAMRQKVEKYEALLGVSMTAMQARMEGLKASIVAAALAAGMEG